ncbi:DALR anticodon-binding domain-containing protein 3 isoform X2 [Ambystoma mexicanum]|uniref:DALR anticodon-binding domain-containing protein 3 isoform X2 n=1 Tax=Ambystoma mexicanum TaxID=8296 RepID=UPI0037E72BE3
MEPLGGVEYPGGLRLSDTVQALSAALRPGEPVLPGLWFKESSSRNLRHRDFLAPKAALSALYRRGQIPEDLIQRISSIHAAGVPPIQSCELTDFGLAVRLERSLVFQQVLAHSPCYLKPSTSNSAIVKNVILNCVALHGCKSPDALKLSHLRAILVADHLAEILRAEGTSVHLVPGLREESFKHFLQELKVPWPSVVEDSSICSATLALKDTLQNSTCAEAFRAEISHLQEQDVQAKDVVCRVRLKGFLEQRCLEGYDPNLDLFTVLEENLQHLAEIQQAVRQCQVEDASSGCMVIHVVNCEEEFQQQKMDLLWQLLEPGEHSASQVTLVLEDTSISTKGTKSGTFVMYNCARLATLFQSYHSGVHQGLYPKLPAPSELNCKTLREEGEWILLFNYILPFPDVLSEAAHLPVSAKGIRITANTEAVCKFLVNLSMDFSSYYNRVHILGEPLPHLYSQMFARLQLMKALQSVLHSALATLHIPPLSQL